MYIYRVRARRYVQVIYKCIYTYIRIIRLCVRAFEYINIIGFHIDSVQTHKSIYIYIRILYTLTLALL